MKISTRFGPGGILFSGLLLLLCTSGAMATPISGTFGTAGAGVVAFHAGGVNYIDWCPQDPFAPAQPGCGVSATGTGDLLAKAGSGFFSVPTLPLFPGVPATILDMTDSVAGVAPYTYFPPNTPNQNIDNFIEISTLAGLNFQADLMTSGSCPGGIIVSAFCLTQTSNASGGFDTTVTTTVSGDLLGTTPGGDPVTLTTWATVLTGQFPNQSIADVIAAASPGGSGAYSESWSSTVVVTAIPEPGTTALMGAGLLALGLVMRRRRP